uniref:sn-1-specific diacylglycerol lipase n=1 Tax=Anopheles coluzzii TaxID=1518534 RepID=A0A8W7Q165_ANOCL
MKKYQRSMRESESRFNYKRSGSRSRNWRQRKVIRAYQDSWDHRCRLLFCCMGNSDRSRNSFTDIARLLSDFFRDLDVVPSDVVAGLVLLRKFQKLEREVIVRQQKNGTHKFLSGVPITASTQFLALNDPVDYDHFQAVIRYMYFAQGAYGWPMYLMSHSSTGVCQLASELRYCFCRRMQVDVVDDNCCFCNYAALKKMLELGEVEVIYATYHVDIAETPFFVAIDYNYNKIVISIRGTLSMKDVLTDLNAEGEPLPLNPPREDWLGHKGMVQAAIYIKQKLEEENLIQRALKHNPARGTQGFGLILVGHSLGAGTAAILAILMKQEYEYSKSFITSVVVGKDVVPRIGLYQMEALRADLINAIQRSIDPKWKTIACSVICCCCGPEPTSVMMMSTKDSNVQRYKQDRNSARQSTVHPNDNSIALTLHHPLYPPGRIIHIVRHHPAQEEQMLKKRDPVYQAIWADNKDFDEVLISPVMIQDHMPDTVLAALEKRGTLYPEQRRLECGVTLPLVAVLAAGYVQDVRRVRIVLREQAGRQAFAHPSASHKQCTGEGRFAHCLKPVAELGGKMRLANHRVLHRLQDRRPPGKTLNFIASANPTRNDMYLMFQPAPVAGGPVRGDSLSLGITRRNSYEVQKIDLIHDDWFGMAPLASPESLSELSSISSRASMSLPDKCFEGGAVGSGSGKEARQQRAPTDPLAAESQLHTPKVLRRTPKVTGNLSTCAEDARTVYQYKRMGKIFVLNQPSSDSSTTLDSYDNEQAVAAASGSTSLEENGLLATISEKDIAPLVAANGSRAPAPVDDPNGNSTARCISSCPACPCRTAAGGKCCPKFNHRECYNYKYTSFNVFKFSKASSSSSSGTAIPPPPAAGNEDNNNVYQSPALQSGPAMKAGLLESHFPVFYGKGGGGVDESAAVGTPSSSISPPATTARSVKPLVPIRLGGVVHHDSVVVVAAATA